MKTLQTILGVLVLALTACGVSPKQGERPNHKMSDTSAMEVGELLLQRDTLNGVTCYHRNQMDGLSCLRDTQP